MKSARTRSLASAVLVGALVLSGCASANYKEARPHVQATVESLDRADASIADVASIDMNSAEASGQVERVISTGEKHLAIAKRELSAAKSLIAGTGESVTKSKWDAMLGEADKAFRSQEALQGQRATFLRQLVVAGMAEVEIPRTDQDLETAWVLLAMESGALGVEKPGDTAVAVMGQPPAELALGSYEALASAISRADGLEPAAGLKNLSDYCDARAEIARLMCDAAKADEAGKAASANRLLRRAYKMDLAMDKRKEPYAKPAIWEKGYSARFEQSQDEARGARERVAQMLATLE